ncbi:ATP-dependent DNA helicase MER3-like protein [Cladobotryum mycophilum]|uniref:ATP-dependent DNA helicase MER3-like protein n=1 Tax=Cladobotryum mycophilum TaxID=491253 RepID=A0ABR0S769_9HYPO
MASQIPASRCSSQPAAQSGSTMANEIQIRYKLSAPTYKILCGIQKAPERRHVLETACQAFEFRSFPIKQAEGNLFREINSHTAIPYPINGSVTQPWHKVFLLVQTDLMRTGWPNKISASGRKELRQESPLIYKLLDKTIRCLVDIMGERQDGRGVIVALDVLRSVKAQVWEGNAMELLQVEGIGQVKMQRLVDGGVRTIKQLAEMEFYHIERLLSRNPPFGHEILSQLSGFPALTMRVEVVDKYAPQSGAQGLDAVGKSAVHQLWVVRVILGYENESLPSWCRRSPWTTFAIEGEDGRLVWFWRGSAKRLDGGKEMVIGLDAKKGENLKAVFACEEIVGTIIRHTFCV